MAGWQRDRNGRVYFYFSENGKQKKVSRAETRHLDNEPDHNIETARRQWGLLNLKSKTQTEILSDQTAIDLIDTFCAYLRSRRKTEKTINQHRHNLIKYCLPFFVQKHKLDPVLWPSKSVKLLEYLESRQVAARTINTCNVSMRVFWRWLTEEGKTQGVLLLRNAMVGQQTTPLNFNVQPADIINHHYQSTELKLLALIGFFFSLRPQELVALRPCDFRAGTAAIELEACKVMRGAGLFFKLAVNVHRQRRGNDFVAPKTNSKGWVGCFDETAAKEIVKLLKELPPYELIFSHRLDWWFKLWRDGGYPGLSLKDLRRSSLYWLGNHTQLTFTGLKNHARHSDPSTTSLYVRRPGQEAGEWDGLDLEA